MRGGHFLLRLGQGLLSLGIDLRIGLGIDLRIRLEFSLFLAASRCLKRSRSVGQRQLRRGDVSLPFRSGGCAGRGLRVARNHGILHALSNDALPERNLLGPGEDGLPAGDPCRDPQ